MSVPEGVASRVRADFGAREAGEALRELAGTETGDQDAERVHAAVVLAAGGNLGQLKRLVALSHVDWRDVLVAGGLADGDLAGGARAGARAVNAGRRQPSGGVPGPRRYLSSSSVCANCSNPAFSSTRADAGFVRSTLACTVCTSGEARANPVNAAAASEA